MKFRVSLLTALLAVPVVSVHAAALQRTDQNVDYLFERGNYFEIGTGYVRPSAKGTFLDMGGNNTGQDTGNITKSFNPWMGAIKLQPTERLSLAFAYEQPFGVTDKYRPSALSNVGGMEAETLAHSFTALAGYRTANNFWVYGGPAYYTVNGSLTLPNLGYRLEVPQGGGWGYVAGVAWEKPDIALRASLTYHSSAKYSKQAKEQFGAGSPPQSSEFTFKMPQSVNLDFRTGIMPKTILITGARWVNWKQFKLEPKGYQQALQTELVSFSKNSWEYKLGVGRQLTDKLGGQVLLTYDTGTGTPVSPLNPTNRSYGIQIGGKYQVSDNVQISAGVRHLWFKDETTSVKPFGTKIDASQFNRTRALGVGVKLGVHF
ncbi:MAG: outer membrane protein transport protein [Neisseria sp.]|nr:outer membrane protein transport protein [Neisseria sp.]